MTRHCARYLGIREDMVVTFNLPMKELGDMSDVEVAALEKQYGCRVAGRFRFGLEKS